MGVGSSEKGPSDLALVRLGEVLLRHVSTCGEGPGRGASLRSV